MKARPGLLILLALAAVFLVVRSLPKSQAGASKTGRPDSTELLGEESGPKGKTSGKSSRPLKIPVLNLSGLEQAPEGETFEIGRNLFRYATARPGPAPGLPGQPGFAGQTGPGGIFRPPGAPPMPPSPLDATPPGPAVPPKPQTPTLTFKYLGSFGTKARLLAVFSDGNEIYDVPEGETFATQFILRKIHPESESVDIGYVGFDEKTIERLEVGP